MAMTNIGALIEPVKTKRVVKPCPPPSDCVMPQEDANIHYARNAGTEYKTRLLQYNQRKAEYAERYKTEMLKDLKDEIRNNAFFKSSEDRFYHKKFHNRIKSKLDKIRASIPIRREKLKKLFVEEAKQSFLETIAQGQKATTDQIEQMRQKLARIREKREKENAEFVKQKRLLQMVDKCDEFRTYFTKKNLKESKRYQMLQIQEKEKQKAIEKEIERMWHELKLKTIEAMEQKEIQEATIRKIKELEDIEIRNKQIEGRKVLVNELNRSREIERIELEKTLKQLEEELIQAKKTKEQKAEDMRIALKTQIEEKQAIHRFEAEQDRIIDEAYQKLLEQTLAAEKAGVVNRKSELRFETEMYQDYHRQIKDAQKQDAAALDKLILEDRMALDAIKAGEQKRLCDYRQELAQQLHADRQLIIEKRRARAEKEKEDLRLYDESIRQVDELDIDIEKKHRAKLLEEQKRYYNDLKEQHCYKLLEDKRKKDEDYEIAQAALETDRQIAELITGVNSGQISLGTSEHPFVPLINKHCECSSRKFY